MQPKKRLVSRKSMLSARGFGLFLNKIIPTIDTKFVVKINAK